MAGFQSAEENNKQQSAQTPPKGGIQERLSSLIPDLAQLKLIEKLFVGTRRPSRLTKKQMFEEAWLLGYQAHPDDTIDPVTRAVIPSEHAVQMTKCLKFVQEMRELSTDDEGRQLDAITKAISRQPIQIYASSPFAEDEKEGLGATLKNAIAKKFNKKGGS
jgi:hypothetical protein